MYSTDLIRSFRDRFMVKENLQYLLFGQMIPENGFAHQEVGNHDNLIRNMKTNNLIEYQEAVRALDDTR